MPKQSSENTESKEKDNQDPQNRRKIRQQKAASYLKQLRIQLYILIIGGAITGGLYSGLSDHPNHEIALIGEWTYFVYEYVVRTISTVIGFYFTIKYYKVTKRTFSRNRKLSFLGLTLSAVIMLIVVPLAMGFSEIYHAYMPFPWMMVPFQIRYNGAVMGTDLTGGAMPFPNGPAIVLLANNLYQLIAFGGTVLLGRKWQCSTICMMAGGHAESLGEALPVKSVGFTEGGDSKQLKPWAKKMFKGFQAYYLLLNLSLIVMWSIYLANSSSNIPVDTLIALETTNYYIFGLMLMVLGWAFVGGRAYCLYCPAGTFLGVCGRLVGQRIETNITRCVNCGKCNDACKMSIDIQSRAAEGKPVKSINCVGCEACVDACPTNNLRYTTKFLDMVRKKTQKNESSGKNDI